MSKPIGSVTERWERNVHRVGNGCWLWMGRHDRDGYAHLDVPSSTSSNGWADRGAHIIAWEMINGDVPLGFVVHHTCEIKGCVNPSHLELMLRGTHQRHHQRREMCKSGKHFMADGYVDKNGRRTCRACASERARKRRQRLRST